MDTELRVRSSFRLTQKGFAIAEVVIAIGLVAIAALIVGGLGQQVLNLSKSSRQTAATLELRTRVNSISRNLDSWLGKMRSSLETNGLYAACIPDPSSATSLFKCPAVDAALLDSDSELKRIAGNQLHAVSAPVIDLLGERIAGTTEEPLYLDLDGRKCQQANKYNCPLKSTGYFLRSNPEEDSTPGSVRFVVKIEANRTSQMNKGTAPQRTQYLSIDVGSEWNQVAGFCPSGSIKIGYLASGSPNCVHPTKKCATGTVDLGLDNSSNPICATPPASCVSGGAIVDTASNTLVCSASSPCSSDQIFLGYYSGTGTPMCSGLNVSCPDGQVQVGIQGASLGNSTAICKSLPSCQDSQKLSYDGSQFVCQSASVASTCGEGEVVVGINTDGSAKCQAAERSLASTNLNCAAGEYVAGLESDGTVKCERLPASSSTSSSTPTTNTALTTNGNICGMRSVYCGGYTASPGYDVYNSNSVPCQGSTLTTSCDTPLGYNAPARSPSSVSGCPTGYQGKFSATGVYFPGNQYQTHYIIYCVGSGSGGSNSTARAGSTGSINASGETIIDASNISQIQIHITATSSGDAFNGSATLAKDENGVWRGAIAGGSGSRAHGEVTATGLCSSNGTATTPFTGGMCAILIGTNIKIKMGSSVAGTYITFK